MLNVKSRKTLELILLLVCICASAATVAEAQKMTCVDRTVSGSNNKYWLSISPKPNSARANVKLYRIDRSAPIRTIGAGRVTLSTLENGQTVVRAKNFYLRQLGKPHITRPRDGFYYLRFNGSLKLHRRMFCETGARTQIPAPVGIPDGEDEAQPHDPKTPACVNQCGDGVCAEITCLAIGCPCAETVSNCPADCK